MPPKKGKRKNKDDDDQAFEDEKKLMQKLAKLEAQESDDEEPAADKLYTKPTKAIYQFDFSNQRALDLKQQPIKPQRNKYEDFTPQQLQQLQRIKQKARLDKQAKNQVKNEKKKQRKKQLQIQKAIQQAEKEKQIQQIKKVQQHIQKQKKQVSSPWTIPLILLSFLILMFVLQYQKQIYQRLSKFKNDDVDHYQTLQADQGTTDRQLKNKYKKLVLKYHPDRNTDCKNCKEKFDKIMKAWQILGDPQKRKSYDQNSGYISQLKSESTTLTPHNYHYLVQQSRHLWLIQVFDSTNTYSRYFAQFWQQLVTNYGDIVKFGRVDVWHQSDMNSYLPYKFQVFPSVYFLDQGYSQICNFNFERPIQGLRKCIQEAYKNVQQKIVKQIPETTDNQQLKKIPVYLDGKLRANIRIKSYNKMFEQYFDYYYVERQSPVRSATVFYKDKKHIFNFTQNSKVMFSAYSQFLQSFIIQQVSTCIFLNECDQRKCILILNKTKIQKIKKQLPLKTKQSKQQYSIYTLTDSQETFEKQIKDMQQHFEYYDIGLYQNGHIDLGYTNQADLLNAQDGERLELQCKVITWKDWIKQKWNLAINYVKGQQKSSDQ